jgi:hypothetical protein
MDEGSTVNMQAQQNPQMSGYPVIRGIARDCSNSQSVEGVRAIH